MVQGPVGCGGIFGLYSGYKHIRVFPALLFLLPGTLLLWLLSCFWLERGFPRLCSHPHLPLIVLILVPLESEL